MGMRYLARFAELFVCCFIYPPFSWVISDRDWVGRSGDCHIWLYLFGGSVD